MQGRYSGRQSRTGESGPMEELAVRVHPKEADTPSSAEQERAGREAGPQQVLANA